MQTMLTVGADKIWVEDSDGSGPPLFLLHEGVGDARMWDPVWEHLTASFRVIRYDVRGFGRSPEPTENFTLFGDAQSVLDQLGVDAAHVVGCSMGGMTALELALAQPDRVRTLVLLCPGISGYPYPEHSELEAQFEALEAAGDQDGLLSLGLEQWAAAGPDPLVTELMRSAQRAWAGEEQFEQAGEPTYDRLGELRVPTALMVGDKDDAGLIASNEAAAARIPGCELIWMPGVDHYPTVRAPAMVVDTIMRHCTD
jgi:pimeloyl-ACP methyl ester carboxylesterase